MRRIMVRDNPRALTHQFEGSLTGPWLRMLEECWQGTLARRHKRLLRVDLTGVTFVDAAGQACLADLHRQGAEFVAADCLTKAVVAEITREPHPDGVGSSGTGESRPEQDGGATWRPTR
jgi:ABC-type transporter Mla MlaB component